MIGSLATKPCHFVPSLPSFFGSFGLPSQTVLVLAALGLVGNAKTLFAQLLLVWASRIAGAQFEESRVHRLRMHGGSVVCGGGACYGATVGAPIGAAPTAQQGRRGSDESSFSPVAGVPCGEVQLV